MALFPNGLKGVIFDCDGVMIDSFNANKAFYNAVLAHYGLPPMTDEETAYCCMASSRQSLEHILPGSLHGDIPRIGTEIVNYDREIMPLVVPYPGYIEFASRLNERGIRQAVLTNRTDRGMKAVLDIFDVPTYVNPVVTASCGFTKPHPGGALHILDVWQVEKGDVLYVGDSDVDRKTADAAGIPFARILQNPDDHFPGDDFAVRDYARLWELLSPFLPRS